MIYKFPSIITKGHVLWTHVTSPFLDESGYSAIIKQYNQALTEGYDSLMTTNSIQGFLWDDNGAINYDRNVEKWPRTQTLNPINEVNSAVFLANSETYSSLKDRIGEKPYLYTLDKIKGFDIDWEDVIVEQANLNAEDFGWQFTGGSQGIRRRWQGLRMAGATAKQMLKEATSNLWQVPISELTVSKGIINLMLRRKNAIEHLN